MCKYLTMNQKLIKWLDDAYNTKETWVLLGNITNRVMIPLQTHELALPTLEAFLRWSIQTFTLMWIGIIMCNLASEGLSSRPALIKPFAFLCGFSPTEIINILLLLAAKSKLPIEIIIPLLHINQSSYQFILSLYNL